MWRQRPAKTHPLGVAPPVGTPLPRARRDRIARRGHGRRRRPGVARRTVGVVHHARSGLPPRVGRRRPRHLGQPRRVAPRAVRTTPRRHATCTARRSPATSRSNDRTERPSHHAATARPVAGRGRPGDRRAATRRTRGTRSDGEGWPQGPQRAGHARPSSLADARVPQLQRAHPLLDDAHAPTTRVAHAPRRPTVREAEYEWEQHVRPRRRAGHRRPRDRAHRGGARRRRAGRRSTRRCCARSTSWSPTPW